MYFKKAAYWGFGLWFVGFMLTYMPLFIAGYLGMPRRYQDYSGPLLRYEAYHQWSTVGSWVLILGLAVIIINVILSVRRGKKTTSNPWHAATLEWTVASPPPTHQFPEPPVITHGPYDYPDVPYDDEAAAAVSESEA